MEKHVKSEHNVGKVVAENPEKGTITVHWKGFIGPIEVPNEGLEVVS